MVRTYESLIRELAVYPSGQSTRGRAAKKRVRFLTNNPLPRVVYTTYFNSIKQFRTNRCHTFEKLGCFIQSQFSAALSRLFHRAMANNLRLEAPSIKSPHPLTSTSTPLCALRSCNSPFSGYITSAVGANTTSGLSGASLSFPSSPPPDDDVDEEAKVGRQASFSDMPSPRSAGGKELDEGRRVLRRERSRSS